MTSDESTTFVAVVDDSLDDASITARAVKKALGTEQRLYHDGHAAIEALTSASMGCGLVFLDARLPKVSGLDVLRALRAHPATTLVPVVVLTSGLESAAVPDFYALQANAVLAKPMDYDEYVAKVQAACLMWFRIANTPNP